MSPVGSVATSRTVNASRHSLPGPTPLSSPTDPTDRVSLTRNEVWVDGLRLATTTVTPTVDHDRSPLVVTLGIMARLDAFEEQRFRLLADRLNRPVIAIDTPGWTRGGGTLPSQVRARLRSGGFDWLAHLLRHALRRAEPGITDLTPSILGYSLGASTASALAHELVASGGQLRGVTLVEPVAIRRQTMPELTVRNLLDARHVRRYAMTNNQFPWAVTSAGPGPLPRATELLLLARAISHGQILHSLQSLPTEVPVVLVSGEHSTLVPKRAVSRFATTLQHPGRRVDQLIVPEAHHALWNSLPVVDRITDWIT